MNILFRGLADLIFPSRCLSCGHLIRADEVPDLCPECRDKIRLIKSPLCPLCGIPYQTISQIDHLCGDCSVERPPFLLARAWGYYEGELMQAIHQYKYAKRTAWGKLLGGLMARAPYPGLSFQEYSLVIPVPLHRRRLRQRGFNQAVLLAREIARRHHLPLDVMNLRRHISTREQTKLGKEERIDNVKGAFSVRDPGRIKGEGIILVDDVYTTGSTVKECSITLMEGQAAKVAVLTAARVVT